MSVRSRWLIIPDLHPQWFFLSSYPISHHSSNRELLHQGLQIHFFSLVLSVCISCFAVLVLIAYTFLMCLPNELICLALWYYELFFISGNIFYHKIFLSDINTATQAFLCLIFTQCIFFHPFTFSLFISLFWNYISKFDSKFETMSLSLILLFDLLWQSVQFFMVALKVMIYIFLLLL